MEARTHDHQKCINLKNREKEYQYRMNAPGLVAYMHEFRVFQYRVIPEFSVYHIVYKPCQRYNYKFSNDHYISSVNFICILMPDSCYLDKGGDVEQNQRVY